jgi:hypothetical protein
VTTSHTIVQILEKDPLPLSKDVPAELERIVLKAMAKDPDERYQTAKDMLIDLRSLKKRLEVQAEIERSSSPSTERAAIVGDEPLVVQRSKRGLVILLVTVMALVTAAIFGINMWRSARERGRAATPPAPVPAASEERTLNYWITVQKYKDGKPYQPPFPLAAEINFEASYQIRVHVSSPQTGHLYIFNEGPPSESKQAEFVVVFPSTTANNNSSLIDAGQVVQIPEKTWLEFDKQQGVETLWLVFSKDAVPELETARQYATPKTKNLISDAAQNRVVQNFLSTQSVSKPAYEKGKELSTLKIAGKFLVYPVKLEHH